jgi:hypothetical protein
MAAPLEDGDLLSERQDFKGGVAPIAVEDAECGQDHKDVQSLVARRPKRES